MKSYLAPLKPYRYDRVGHPLHRQPVRQSKTGLLEVLCAHGGAHPMRESVQHMDTVGPPAVRGTWGAHQCDGCCAVPSTMRRGK